MKRKFRNMLFLAALSVVLSGCGQTAAESADAASSTVQQEITTEAETDTDVAENTSASGETGNGAELIEDIPSEPDTPEQVEYVEWDGSQTLKKNTAEPLGRIQYYHGKTYVVDKDDTVLGEPFPVTARQTEEGMVKPRISFFYFTEDTLFYLEESQTILSYYLFDRCFNLYAQSLETGEVKLLAEMVGDAVYQEDVIVYKKYNGDAVEEKDEVVRKIDAKTGELLDEINLGSSAFVTEFNKDFICYFSDEDEKDRFYFWSTQELKEARTWGYFIHGNMYGFYGFKLVLLYERGEEVMRVYPKQFPWDAHLSQEKVFYQEGRKVMMYDLETGEDSFVCELGSNEYGENELFDICESGGMVLLQEGLNAPPGEYGSIYLYEVQNGEKRFVTGGFWTS